VSSSEASGAKTVLGGRYRLLRRLGSGGMATVWMARDERLGRDVAVKVLSDVLAGDERYARRFEREARVAAGLNHPGLVPVLDFGAESDAHIWSWSWFGATRSRDGSPLGRPANLTSSRWLATCSARLATSTPEAWFTAMLSRPTC
jgi:serine/threonine protein kinase